MNDPQSGVAADTRAPGLPVEPLPAQLGRLVMSYLPLLVMALLALGTWWLVENTPVPTGPGVASPLRHEPDYTMRQFTVLRFARDGSLRTKIEGDVAHHYPDTDTLEVENPRIRAVAPDGTVTSASARRALVNGDGSEAQLLDSAHVIREATPTDEAIDFRSDFLHIFVNTERVRSHVPVRIRQGTTDVQAAAMEYDNLARVIDLKGRMHGVFASPPGRGAATGNPPKP